jgi:hypothetical protein
MLLKEEHTFVSDSADAAQGKYIFTRLFSSLIDPECPEATEGKIFHH